MCSLWHVVCCSLSMLVHCEWFWLNTSSKSTEISSGFIWFSLTLKHHSRNFIYSELSLNAGFHWQRSRDRSQMRSVERYDIFWWKSDRQSRKQNIDSAYDSVAYDPVKTTLSESQAEHRFHSRLRRLWSSENQIAGVENRSRSHFSFWLRQSSFHWIVSDGVLSGIGRK